jgi:hypothetical protein
MAGLFDTCVPYSAPLRSGLYSQAVEEGLTFLTEVKRFAPSEYGKTPKGTPFYLLGIASCLPHDFQTATFLFDAAVSEDLKFQPHNQNAPALLTMRLNDDNVNHAAHPIVTAVVKKIEAALTSYNGRAGSRTLTLVDVRQHFWPKFLQRANPTSER